MTVNKENIRKAIDSFEEDNFVDSEELLKKEIKRAKNDYFKNELELEQDIETVEDDVLDDTDVSADETDNDSDPDE